MKHYSSLAKLTLAWLLASSLLAAKADTFFSDTFGSGSTVNQTPTTNISTTATSYQSAVGSASATASIAANTLTLTFPTATTLLGEVMGLFTNSPMSLNVPGDTIAVTVVFTNKQNILFGSANASLNIGLFNSGGVSPLQGSTTLGATALTGGSQNWIGYAARIFTNGNANIFTRPVQISGKAQDQDLLFTGASSTTAFNNPAGTSLGSTAGTINLAQAGTYTLYFSITLTGAGALQVTNTLYAGAGTGGTVVFTQTKSATGATYLTSSFNGFAIGWRNSSPATQVSAMTISSITVSGNITGGGTPSIVTQPIPVAVATGGYCPFAVVASGAGLTYQWHRNGTNLLNGGNISGATASTLIINSASAADVASGANGYYVTVTSAGTYSTNSVTNSLSLNTAKTLFWTDASSTVWDLNNSVNWQDSGATPQTFNYGDVVTFNDIGTGGTVALNDPYLAAASVAVNSSFAYRFASTSTGGFAGPGALTYSGAGQLTIENANTYTGGTLIQSGAGRLLLKNNAGLGTGSVTLANAGGTLELFSSGSATTGIIGDVNVNEDFTIQTDGIGAFAAVLLGNLNGVANKTLTFSPADSTTTNRFRVYGTNTVCNANITLIGNASSAAQYDGTVLACYGASGSQTYNGVIAGNGGIIQRAAAILTLNGNNTYSGGTTPTTGTIAVGHDNALGAGSLNIAPEQGSANGSGTIIAVGGARTIANTIQYPSGTNNQTLIIGGTNNINFTGSLNLNGVDGQGTPSSRTVQVNNSGATTFSMNIQDAGAGWGFTKTGTNTLYLNGANTYSALTTVSAGTLAGSGTIAGSVTVTTNASISGGAAASIGTLHISGNLTLTNGSGYFRINRSGLASDLVSVAGGLTNFGTGIISITNQGATLQVGDVFTLFNKPMFGGSTLTVTGVVGVVWTNKLAVNGTIEVLPNVNLGSTNLTAVVNAGKLELGWPSDHTGWRLQAQTNALTSGLGTNWVTIPGTDASNHYTNTFDTTKGAIFYRMVYP